MIRRPGGRITRIIVVNCLFFLLQILYPHEMIQWFALIPDAVLGRLQVWRLVTYMFLHGGFLHLFMNMFALYIFGADLLHLWGGRRFLLYYFFTGIGAGLFALVLTSVPTIGSSGSVFGILVAYGLLFPNRLVYLYLLFPIKAKYLVVLFGVLELMATIWAQQDGIAHIAHLGGMFFGLAYLAFPKIWDRHRRSQRLLFFRTRHPEWWETPYDKEEIDRILDKILSDGIEKLTPDERRKLVKAGKIIAQRRKEREV